MSEIFGSKGWPQTLHKDVKPDIVVQQLTGYLSGARSEYPAAELTHMRLRAVYPCVFKGDQTWGEGGGALRKDGESNRFQPNLDIKAVDAKRAGKAGGLKTLLANDATHLRVANE